MASSKPLIAFYGATGGSTLAALVPALKAGYDCTALARTPSKLTSMLLSKGVPESSINDHLTISQGDVLNIDSCKGPLTLNGRPADIIISGIGIVNLSEALSEVKFCADAVSTILTALQQLKLPTKPLFTTISTTGISSGPRDVPLLLVPLYHILLAHPHKDKKRMENLLVEHAKSADSVISDYVIIRAALLTSGKAYGKGSVRVGSEENPAVGYYISRDDVGLWIFENLIEGEGGRFGGKKVSITY